jgi:hypothetical protein
MESVLKNSVAVATESSGILEINSRVCGRSLYNGLGAA